MRVITAISPVKRKAGGFAVKVDGRIAATLRESSVVELRLEVGRAWDEHLAEQVARAQAFDKAFDAALGRLNRRAMSRRQLKDKLEGLGHEEAIAERVLDRLADLGFLDDEAFGRELIRQTVDASPAGPRLLRSKLAQRGLEGHLIDRLVAEQAPSADQAAEEAAALARKKLATLTRLDPPARKRRLWAMLVRRGFDHDTIETALRGLDGLNEMNGS